MKRKQNFIAYIYSLISLLLLTIFPSLLLPLVPIPLLPLSALICLLLIAILVIIVLLIKRDSEDVYPAIVANVIPEFIAIKHVQKVRIYAITTSNIITIFSHYNFTIDECTIILRYCSSNPFYLTDEIKAELNAKIDLWKMFVANGRIKRLTIIGCNNIPDDNFIIFDDSILAMGINNFNSSDPSKQSVSMTPVWFVSKNHNNKIIERYINHFNNYETHYKNDNSSVVFLDNYQLDTH